MSAEQDDYHKPVIGWREWLALPELGIEHIKAKVDTGARTSALHAFDLRRFKRRGRDMVSFKVHPLQKDTHTTIEAEAVIIDERTVRSSMGRDQLRPVIRVEVGLLGERWPIELTLTARDAMGFRMLLGREAVRRRFVIDPGRSFLGGRWRARVRPHLKAKARGTGMGTGKPKGSARPLTKLQDGRAKGDAARKPDAQREDHGP